MKGATKITTEMKSGMRGNFKEGEPVNVHRTAEDDMEDGWSSCSLSAFNKAAMGQDLNHLGKGADKTGVLYMSHVPKGMKPGDLREMLSPFGKLGRIYLAPSERVSDGRAFSEGWIEFARRKDALRAALLNTQPMVGKRFKDRLWTLKYLKAFKWSDLSAQKTYDNAVREQRGRAERSLVRREVGDYMDRVERNRTNAKIRAKRAERGKIDTSMVDFETLKCQFKQRKPIEPGLREQ